MMRTRSWPPLLGGGTAVLVAAVLALTLAGADRAHGLRQRHHQRHRREPLADPQFFEGQITKRVKEEQKQNQYKPKFTACEDYKPEVEEQSPRGKTRPLFPRFGPPRSRESL